MTKVTFLPRGRNSKARRKLKQDAFYARKRLEYINKAEAEGDCGPPDPRNGIPEHIHFMEKKLVKIITSPSLPRDHEKEEIAPKDDVMFRVVNHAHQRNPKKKW
ncbi:MULTISPECIES: transcriptional regulator [unclassified Photorhabdus]|uniref:transcriptional regulator n=1 Tax=unclassified Photorhabdus TaxID=2620880 RepID=UPI001EFD6C53|nr:MULTISPECIES: transcriptional regulator [unclassified Photorhabdus]